MKDNINTKFKEWDIYIYYNNITTLYSHVIAKGLDVITLPVLIVVEIYELCILIQSNISLKKEGLPRLEKKLIEVLLFFLL